MEDNNVLELITKMYAEMKEGFSSINNRIDNVETKVDNLENKVDNLENTMNKRFDELTSDISNLVSKDIAEGISSQIDDIKTDLGFVKHKLNATEEDVYKIQSHLKIIK